MNIRKYNEDILEWIRKDATKEQQMSIVIDILERKNQKLEIEKHQLQREIRELYRQIRKDR